MDASEIFLQRYDPVFQFYLPGFWKQVPSDLMRARPQPRVNSIAWNIWHLARVEDAGVNLFVADREQVLDEGGWMARMNVPWRHHGTNMTFDEVDELNRRIDLTGLHDYSRAVEERTRAVVAGLDLQILDDAMGEERLWQIMDGERLAHSDAEGFVQNYLGWSKAKCLFSFGLTHSYLHLGEMEVIAHLLGVEFG